MSNSQEPSPDQRKSTYIIDADNTAEMARLMLQDQLINTSMGGVLPEIDLSGVQRVLDVACGPGGWPLSLAYTYSDMEVVGIDISEPMIAYARAQAEVQQRTNVSFRVMDVLKPLAFPIDSFDLINVRFVSTFMLRDKWPVFFQEILRVLRPGGIVRLTEVEMGMSNKPHFEKTFQLVVEAMGRAGLNFSPNGNHYGILHMLPFFFRQAGLPILGKRAHFIEFSFGTEIHECFYKDVAIGLQLVEPLIVRMQLTTPEEWRNLVQRVLAEMYEEDFCAAWVLLTVWAEKPFQG
jgi:ubiquinone/menaquinone biosynthesis C-methylase UbiE